MRCFLYSAAENFQMYFYLLFLILHAISQPIWNNICDSACARLKRSQACGLIQSTLRFNHAKTRSRISPTPSFTNFWFVCFRPPTYVKTHRVWVIEFRNSERANYVVSLRAFLSFLCMIIGLRQWLGKLHAIRIVNFGFQTRVANRSLCTSKCRHYCKFLITTNWVL